MSASRVLLCIPGLILFALGAGCPGDTVPPHGPNGPNGPEVPISGEGPQDTVVGEPVPDGGGGSPPIGPRHEQYIRSEFYPRLVIEVDAVEGKLAPVNVESAVAEGFMTVLDKPEGILIQRDATSLAPRGPDYVWTFAELAQFARENFNYEVPSGTIKIHTLLVDGVYENSNVLGVAWSSKYLVLFKDRLDRACNAGLGVVSKSVCDETLRGVWVHELGHVIGLVNNGVAMQEPHQDEAHGAHDESDGCIMYWAYETPTIVDRVSADLGGGTKLGFDAKCLADIAAVRER